MSKASHDIPDGYTVKDHLVFGSRVPGLLEIKFHNPGKRNAITTASNLLLVNLLENAQKDESIKVIFLHGGLFYGAGTVLFQEDWLDSRTPDQKISYFVHCQVQLIKALNFCNKPIVGLIRGRAVGMSFNLTAAFDFIYLSPTAHCQLVFTPTLSSPFYCSTYNLPNQLGIRKSREMQLLSGSMTA